MSTHDLERNVQIASHRGKFYVIFKSGAVQRWAAKQVGDGKDFSTLNSTLWRKSGITGQPAGCESVVNPGSTYNFRDAGDACNAVIQFFERLRHKGVKI